MGTQWGLEVRKAGIFWFVIWGRFGGGDRGGVGENYRLSFFLFFVRRDGFLRCTVALLCRSIAGIVPAVEQ